MNLFTACMLMLYIYILSHSSRCMSALKSILLCITSAFFFYLIYRISMGFYTEQFKIMEMVSDVGTLFICIDLMVFLWYSRKSSKGLQDYTQRSAQQLTTVVKVCRKLGHFGILLIICSWIVPIINA